MDENENFVPRVNQLDAEELDQEILNIFKGGLQNAFKYFLRNPLDLIGPELEAIIKIIIWNFTLRARNSSIGQELLGIEFIVKNRLQIVGTGFLNIVLKYLEARQSSIVRLFPGREEMLNKSFQTIQNILKFAELVNFVIFLQNGIYPNLIQRLLKLKPRPVVQESRSVGYSFMTRELMWHLLTELVIFLVPLIDISSFYSKIRPSKADENHCATCLKLPIVRISTPCSHVFCYYCLVSSSSADGEYIPCPVCGTKINKQTICSTIHS
ncbi:peroxisome biogenesis factor 2 [Eurytemora carolleeae]|uniref:peroxisome biogenesis factor 2 n=1 Tax=Eurytemora carolleeae TaxID=1294199 RepID=UPI000C76E599|nr:peroxisome biogenesis factor 2 [Eurytemora carolleeae]|eukprot:XP_023335548.1 peroxisome biogenesis factor 2-like [Eurytemora affinis]